MPEQRVIPIVDAHQHFWDLQANYLPWLRDEPLIPFRYGDYTAIRRNYLPEDLRRDSASFDLVGSVYVEAEWDPTDPLGETRWVHALASREGLPTAMVAQAWLDREDVAELLAAQAGFPLVRGIRHKPKAAPRPADLRRGTAGSMSDPKWREGYALLARHGLSFDLQVVWWHFEEAAELAADFPETQIIVNHTGLPADRSEDGLAQWRRMLATLARQPNVALKISGLGRRDAPWTVEANGPVVRDAISIFGVERCMFASNFPVDSLVGSYSDIFNGFLAITASMPHEHRLKLFCENAKRFYRIEAAAASSAISA
ncbi:amidohydrolase family protein [Chelatococcus sp. GCM10030263]|uniref:amidohydrolase family protein n=1 Tax=Chelatococcus sp. GCM10030263 TaxID=3273387 RepID=UPI00361FC51B